MGAQQLWRKLRTPAAVQGAFIHQTLFGAAHRDVGVEEVIKLPKNGDKHHYIKTDNIAWVKRS